MIAGNPNSARKFWIVAVCFFVVLMATAGYLAFTHQAAPQHKPPLHPSSLVTALQAGHPPNYSING